MNTENLRTFLLLVKLKNFTSPLTGGVKYKVKNFKNKEKIW